jgi:hypothetical protein
MSDTEQMIEFVLWGITIAGTFACGVGIFILFRSLVKR